MDLTRSVKYGLDRILAMALLVLLSPFLLLVAIAIRLESPGSAIFLQERMGLHARPFTIFKFRTMRADPEKEKLDVALVGDDARLTRVGAFLRRTGIDEIPQLVNILLGEMSFIGPRPTLRSQVEAYTARQSRRLLFRPGLTGWAQVHGRNRLSWEERIELDLHYVEHFSLWLDLRILWRTIHVVLRGDGVYASAPVTGAPPTPRGGEAPRTRPLVVVGIGSHARAVVDTIERSGRFRIVGFVAEGDVEMRKSVFGYPLLGGREALQGADVPKRAVVAITSPSARGAWISHLSALGYELPCLVHPSVTLGKDVSLGEGCVLLAGSIVQSGTRLGRGVIVNSGALVDTDCDLADLVHVAHGARLAESVQVGARSCVGLGACVGREVRIGANVIVGPGAVVVGAIPSGATVMAVPARVVMHPGPASNPRAPAVDPSLPSA